MSADGTRQQSGGAPRPLDGMLVVTLEQAVAAPFATRQLADLGARVIKIERPGRGDFARHYDGAAGEGMSSWFVWLNRSKESVVLDLKTPGGRAALDALIGRADVFVCNLSPAAITRLGLDAGALAARHPRLVACQLSGYGDDGPYADRKAYDLLVQAESGLASITGTEHAPGRVGVSATDIGTGMYAHAAVLEALLSRQKTGEGRALSVSLFSSMAEWMAVPLLAKDYADYEWPRLGLTHPFIAPYGVYQTADKVPVLISIQNDREFERLCHDVLDRPGLEKDPDYATNKARNARRDDTNAIVQKSFGAQRFAELAARLDAAQIAWARVSSVADLSTHPQLRRVAFGSPNGEVSIPALAVSWAGEPERLGDVPSVGQHTAEVRREFGA